MRKKVLVLTDQEYLYIEFVKIIQNVGLESIVIYYGCSSKNKKLINNHSLTPYDLKVDASRISDNFDLVISLHCQQVFPSNLLEKTRCVNIHPGYNPYNRGWYPHVFSIINKLPTGVTIHEMDDKIDHGPIIIQEEVSILSSDNSFSLYNRILQTELRLIKDNIKYIINKDYTLKSVPEGNINSKIDYERLCEIDLDEIGTFRSFLDRLRCLTHGEYKNAYFIDENGRKVFLQLNLSKRNSE